jgi:hypothetical protein
LPFTSNVRVSASDTVPPFTESWNDMVSPLLSAYIVIPNSSRPAYGPKGGAEGVCTPRSSVPANAISVPDDWMTPLSVIKAVSVIVLLHWVGLKTKRDGDNMG